MKTSQIADKILVALVKIFEAYPAILTEGGFELDIWDLAAEASIINKNEADERRRHFHSGLMDNLPTVTSLLVQRGWVVTHKLEDYKVALYPTPEGIDHGHWLMRPRYKKVLGYFREYFREIAVASVTAAVTTLVTYFIIEWIR